jgi:putative ABC transport system ATP-binding protein
MNPIIETQSIRKIYESSKFQVVAVDNASIQVFPGEFAALVGPSGSGKTTMLAMLAALLEPSTGKVFIDNADINAMSEMKRVEFRRQKIGFTFQSNNLVPFLTVRENIEMMLRLNKTLDVKTRTRVAALLDRIGLQEAAERLPNQLSGGQRQRVAIARSMIHEPSVILADEPTASLDTERAYQVTQLYADLIHENQKAGIMVTHDLRLCKYVDKVIRIEDGIITSIIADRQEIDALSSH